MSSVAKAMNMSLTPKSEGRDIKATAFIDSLTIKVKHLPTVRASGFNGCGAKVMTFLQRKWLTSSSNFHLGNEKIDLRLGLFFFHNNWAIKCLQMGV